MDNIPTIILLTNTSEKIGIVTVCLNKTNYTMDEKKYVAINT